MKLFHKYNLFHRVNQEAVGIQFEIDSIPHIREKELIIKYMNRELDKRYKADFICFDKIIIELKALSSLTTDHEAQVLNYLHPV